MSVSAVALTYSSRGKVKYQPCQRSAASQRDKLVLEHAEMVRRVGYHLADRLEGSVDPDDLVQTGMVGLLEAAERYSPIEGIPFEAYALTRVRGAMLDGIRRHDWCPRNVRKQGRILHTARDELTRELGRPPSQDEVAAHTGLSKDECRRIEMSLDNANISSLDMLLENGESFLPVDSDRSLKPIEKQRLQKALVEALKQLPEREQLIMSLYYDDELNQREIAQAMELTEARISQLRSKAVKTLRKKLSDWM